MPIADGLLGSYFGMFADKYGIQWMAGFATVSFRTAGGIQSFLMYGIYGNGVTIERKDTLLLSPNSIVDFTVNFYLRSSFFQLMLATINLITHK